MYQTRPEEDNELKALAEVTGQMPHLGALQPLSCERPVNYADRIGRFYADATSSEHRKGLGQYLTPPEVADFMASLRTVDKRRIRVLDPGAGAGILTCALCERLSQGEKSLDIIVDAYEVDTQLASLLDNVLSYLQRYLRERGHTLSYRVENADFILKCAGVLNPSKTLFPEPTQLPSYDEIIANPPYFKIQKIDPRSKAAAAVVHGQPNIYALFMAVAAHLLNDGGELSFITPRSFASGPYFRLFREKFFATVCPISVHVFDSRKEAFGRDEVLQENVIIRARRVDRWFKQADDQQYVEVSSSSGVADLPRRFSRCIPLRSIIDMQSRDKVLRIPANQYEEEVIHLIESWPGSLQKYGLQISTGPVVAFRARDLLVGSESSSEERAPMLWMQNVRPLTIDWPLPLRNKAKFIKITKSAMPLLLASKNYVLTRRFTSKEERRRLVAAPLMAESLNSRWIGLENHLNYIYRPGGEITVDEAWGLAALFNSTLLDTYFRSISGNTQVSATELRAMPLPSIEAITEIGLAARQSPDSLVEVDSLIQDLFGRVGFAGQMETAID